jgi:hypothetical protein
LLHHHTDLHPAARDALLDQRTEPRFERGERRWYAELHVEKFVVDRPHGHADGRRVAVAGERGESGHALDHETDG